MTRGRVEEFHRSSESLTGRLRWRQSDVVRVEWSGVATVLQPHHAHHQTSGQVVVGSTGSLWLNGTWEAEAWRWSGEVHQWHAWHWSFVSVVALVRESLSVPPRLAT